MADKIKDGEEFCCCCWLSFTSSLLTEALISFLMVQLESLIFKWDLEQEPVMLDKTKTQGEVEETLTGQ